MFPNVYSSQTYCVVCKNTRRAEKNEIVVNYFYQNSSQKFTDFDKMISPCSVKLKNPRCSKFREIPNNVFKDFLKREFHEFVKVN